MSNAPVIREVVDVVRPSRPEPVQQTATARKQAQTAAKGVASERREAVAAAAEKSAAARSRRGRGGYRSLLSQPRGGMNGANQLARTLGGTE